LLVVGAQNQRAGASDALSYPDLRDWNEAASSVIDIGASQWRSMTLSDAGREPERYQGAAITSNLFPVLGIEPILGRGFAPDEDRPGAAGVMLLSHHVWTTRYQSDPGTVGRSVLIEGTPHTIIGVMPPGFAFPDNQRLWIPLGPTGASSPREARNLFAIGRLAPGASREQARQALDAAASQLAKTYPRTNGGWTSRFETLREAFLPDEVTLILGLMMAAAVLVLFIACSNVANLQLARGVSRQREIAVRAAIGAGRGRLVRLLLAESVVLGLASVPLGILLAVIGTRLLSAAMPVDQVPYYVTWSVDWRTMLYAAGIAVVTALVFGLFPALHVVRGSLHATLKDGMHGASIRRSRLRGSLVVAQVAMAVVALVGALLFLRSYANIGGADIGFDTAPLMSMRMMLTGESYEAKDARLRRVTDLVERIEARPGVESAFASNFVPISGGGWGPEVEIDGRTPVPGEDITLIGATAHMNRTIGLPLVRGRDFTDAEGRSATPVAVINETMASRFWPGREAVGGRFRMKDQQVWFTVIGVAKEANLYGVGVGNVEPPSAAFVPFAYQQTPNVGLTIRMRGVPSSITAAVRDEVHAADPNIPIFQVRTTEETRRLGYWQEAVYAWVFATIGVTGLLLASMGVFGVLAYSVSQRSREIGVRMALGASSRDVLRLVVTDGVLLAGIGLAIGLVLAPLGTRFAQTLLYRVGPFDPLAFIAVSVLLLVVAAAASYAPARRAARIDPLAALREQ
ncbi:MAG TPA: ABC transporter permease, partial [Vicinamibacterales bacterium]|nr:ABC transporter permease [Vicinamibacterales bacterium]